MAETSTIFGFMKYVSATDILSDFKKPVDSHFVNSLKALKIQCLNYSLILNYLTNCTIAIGAASPRRIRVLTTRVYPPLRSAYAGPISMNNF